jgi:hypothetical protein
MLAGETYNIHDPVLQAERETAKELVRLFDSTETPSDRLSILQKMLARSATVR